MGAYTLNNLDLQTAFGITVERGSDDFLQLPKAKKHYSYNWGDFDGEEIDATEPVLYEPRQATLTCVIHATTEAAFKSQYAAFEAELRKAGLQRLWIEELQQAYFIKYEKMGNLFRFTPIRNPKQPIAARFTLEVVEPIPDTNAAPAPGGGGTTPVILPEYKWGFSDAPILPAAYAGFQYQFVGGKGATPTLNFTNAANYKYLIIQQPSTAPQYANWYNTQFNYGKFPDTVFYATVVQGAFRYYVSRTEVLLDKDTPSIKLS